MAREAIERGALKYEDENRRYWRKGEYFRQGYLNGTRSMSSPLREERMKMQHGRTCCYCGSSSTKVQMEHVFPKSRGGTDAGNNLLSACRRCNSSKGARDMVLWIHAQGKFPPILVMSRYLKLAAEWCDAHNLMNIPWNTAGDAAWPFDKKSLRMNWPEQPRDHQLGIVPFVVELREWRTPCFRTEVVYSTPRQQPHRRAGPARPRRRPGSAGRGSPAPAGSAAPPPPARSPPSVESSGRRATA